MNIKEIVKKNFRKLYKYHHAFLPITPTLGVKLFFSKGDRDDAYHRQLKAYKAGLAPKIFNKGMFHDVEATHSLHSKYWYYITELAYVIPNIDDNRYLGYGEKYMNLKTYPGIRILAYKLRKIGLDPRDLHLGNIGYINRRLVCIDFDNASMG